MHLTFTLTRSDYTALQKVAARRLTELAGANWKLMIVNVFVWIPLGVAFGAYGALFRKYPELSYDLSVVAVAFCSGVLLLVVGALYKQSLYRAVVLSPKSWFLSEQAVDLDEAGLSASGSYGTIHYPWASFCYHTEDGRNLYLFIDNNQAFVLPKAVVGSVEQLSRIKDWLPK